ncbi:MAG: hypothetical protein N0E48_16065 [Candidatus Thiodiazotropha endolucinida]|nr:hypothetical protein [Candidatus Thiodiazotropha taylori]MCW4344847.1 hypothetical protein [Candidatus Thiodiazotropha endolucinida]
MLQNIEVQIEPDLFNLRTVNLIMRPAEIGDFQHVTPVDYTLGDDLMKSADWGSAMLDNLKNYAFTICEFDTNETVVIVCLEYIWPGRWFAWMIADQSVKRYYKPVYRLFKELLPLFCDSYNVRRLEAITNCKFKEGQRWLKHLGFEIESYLKYYHPNGDDCYMYTRINDHGHSVNSTRKS